jgi:S1-C subfamily serine protease
MHKYLAVLLMFSCVMSASAADVSIQPIHESVEPVEHKVVEIHMHSATPAQAEESSRKKSRKVETLPFGGGTCSGSFVDSFGDVLTAKHCVTGFDSWEVQTYDGKRYAAIVVAKSVVHDLALLHIDRMNTPHFTLAARATRGEPISVLGSPLGITDTLSRGFIAKLDGDVTLIDCGALPGNSGGPVINDAGELVGLVNAGLIVLFGTTHLNRR